MTSSCPAFLHRPPALPDNIASLIRATVAAPHAGTLRLWTKRIEHLQKRETVEIRVPGADAPDSMLAHEDGRVGIVDEIAGEVRQLGNDLLGDFGVPLRLDENAQPRRGKERGDELPSRRNSPRAPHHARMSRDAQELVQNRPGRVPGIRAYTLTGKPSAARFMELGVNIGGVHQHIGVHEQH